VITTCRSCWRASKLGREIVQTRAFDEMRGKELIPGPVIGTDEKKLRKYITDTCITDWHPSGTCKMGLDAKAVVDPRLRVYGIDGLRVVDASIMPSVVSGNLQASIFMIGEKASDMILEDASRSQRKDAVRTVVPETLLMSLH